ncbi:MAG: pyridoxal phosphate-dependent aminotransferase [Clostridiales bacterium]|nr:pyridoxal phosphate-dependent aminotransferase [Clostridiales bacterium]MDD3418415.1 pyridoxal phosphate-dependent aminotransferase [Eubacteriales bacterium]
MRTSKRSLAMQASPIRKLVPYANAAKARGTKVYHLNIGQPDIETPKVFMDAVRAADIDVLAYADSNGWEPLRESIAAYYQRMGLPYVTEDVIITNGGSEALQWALLIACDPGEEVLVPEPFYTNYRGFAAPYLVEISPITTYPENGFALPEKAVIESRITKKTRGILLSNPGNPAGVVYTAEEVRMVADIARENDLYIIADEVYREFCYDGKEATSFGTMTDVLDRIIIIDSVSKRFSACGARIGSLTSKNKEVMAAALKLGQARLCVPTLEMIGSKALYDLDPDYFAPIRARYEERRNILVDALQKMDGVLCETPGGAFYAVAKLPVDNAEKFAIWLLTDFELDGKTVMLAPVENFYQTPGMGVNEARVAYVLNSDDLKEAMRVLKAALEAYPGRTA